MATEFRVERSSYRLRTDIWIVSRGSHSNGVAAPVVFHEVARHEVLPEPTISLSDDEAQQAIDELWRAGFRPTEGTGSAGSLAATQAHLSDMRKIATDCLSQIHMDNAARRSAQREE